MPAVAQDVTSANRIVPRLAGAWTPLPIAYQRRRGSEWRCVNSLGRVAAGGSVIISTSRNSQMILLLGQDALPEIKIWLGDQTLTP